MNIFLHKIELFSEKKANFAPDTTYKTNYNMRALNYLVAFLGGAAIGTACGLLFAPEKGSDLREKIAEALRKRGIRLNRKEMDSLIDEIAEELQSTANDDE